jgi:hypothetical protein
MLPPGCTVTTATGSATAGLLAPCRLKSLREVDRPGSPLEPGPFWDTSTQGAGYSMASSCLLMFVFRSVRVQTPVGLVTDLWPFSCS